MKKINKVFEVSSVILLSAMLVIVLLEVEIGRAHV